MNPGPETADLLPAALRAPTFLTVRRRVFRQLLESLVYERAIDVVAEDTDVSAVAALDANGEEVRYVFTARRCFGFDRVRITGPVLRVSGEDTAEADSPTRFLAEARRSLSADQECLPRFARELEETLVKDALAQYVRADRDGRLRDADYDTLEGAITDGHRYHPTYKSRIGFDLDDNLAYGPEFGQPIRPLWTAARRTLARVTLSTSLSEDEFLSAQLGSESRESFRQVIIDAGEDPDDYTLLPAHPWQWRAHLGRAFADQLRSNDLIVVGADPHPFTAQQSIRTLGCPDQPDRPHLKLALSIVNTSTSRVLAPHTVGNAPAVSDWLDSLVRSDDFLHTECGTIVLREVMGSVVDPMPMAEFVRAETYGTLACIWRESIHTRLRSDERAVPFTGLTACEVDGTPLIDSWVRAAGIAEWLTSLVRVSVIPLLHLLFGHGVACESHAQNMVLVHSGGVPTRVALKDFHDGVRFSRRHLADPARCPDLMPPPAHHVNANSFLETDDLDLVTDFLLDAFFFVNLGELGLFLAEHYGFDEREFWSLVRSEITAYQGRFPELKERFALFDVTKPEVAVEKLTTRRLLPDTELRLHSVSNPLADPR